MALFDFLKRKKEVAKAKKPFDKAQGRPAKKAEKASVTQEPRKNAEINAERRGKKEGKFSYNVIKEPHISEKASNLASENKYTFKVYANSNKPEIKKSVEGIYGVNVLDVKIINIPHKKRRLGSTQGFKKAFRKAIVKIKEGQKIEVL